MGGTVVVTVDTTGPLLTGTAVRPAAGQDHCGDRAVVARHGDRLLLAVIDGLGHGPGAQDAAETAERAIRAGAAADLPDLLRACHDALRHTRGAAIGLVAIEGTRLAWLGVGNVQGVVRAPRASTRRRLLTRAGIVGASLPAARPRRLELAPGDVLLVYTDGVADEVGEAPLIGDDPQQLADHLLAEHGHDHDDSLLLVGVRVGTR